jgi:hypothetical protein
MATKTLNHLLADMYKRQNLMAKLLTDMVPKSDTITLTKKEAEILSIAFCDIIDYLNHVKSVLGVISSPDLDITREGLKSSAGNIKDSDWKKDGKF